MTTKRSDGLTAAMLTKAKAILDAAPVDWDGYWIAPDGSRWTYMLLKGGGITIRPMQKFYGFDQRIIDAANGEEP